MLSTILTELQYQNCVLTFAHLRGQGAMHYPHRPYQCIRLQQCRVTNLPKLGAFVSVTQLYELVGAALSQVVAQLCLAPGSGHLFPSLSALRVGWGSSVSACSSATLGSRLRDERRPVYMSTGFLGPAATGACFFSWQVLGAQEIKLYKHMRNL